MSIESLKARLAEASPGPWEAEPDDMFLFSITPENDPETRIDFGFRPVGEYNADLIAHAPTDLAAALQVIEAVKQWDSARTELTTANAMQTPIEREPFIAAYSDAVDSLLARLNDFEALP